MNNCRSCTGHLFLTLIFCAFLLILPNISYPSQEKVKDTTMEKQDINIFFNNKNIIENKSEIEVSHKEKTEAPEDKGMSLWKDILGAISPIIVAFVGAIGLIIAAYVANLKDSRSSGDTGKGEIISNPPVHILDRLEKANLDKGRLQMKNEDLENKNEELRQELKKYQVAGKVSSEAIEKFEAGDYSDAESLFKRELREGSEKKSNAAFFLGNIYSLQSNFNEALKFYKLATDNNPENYFALYNWGTALAGLALMKEGKQKEELFKQATEKYEAALKIKPDYAEALNNWGNTLAGLARMKEGKEKEELFKQAAEKYEAALKIKPDLAEALYNWGTALADLALMKEGKEKEELCKQAAKKYEAALKIEPDDAEALYHLELVKQALSMVSQA